MKVIPGVLIIVFTLIVAATCSNGSKQEKQKNAPEKKEAIAVKVAPVTRGDLVITLNYKGTVWPRQIANITPDAPGRVAKIYAKPGDAVKKGQLLAELDATTQKLQLNQAEAVFAVSQAAYKDAAINFQRVKSLFAKTAVSRMQFEKAQLAMEAADTQLKSAAAAVYVIKHTLDNSYMRAPFDGVVVSQNMNEGDIINPLMGVGMTPSILTVMDISQVKLVLDVPADDIEKIFIGQDCRLKCTTLPDEYFNGQVYSKNLAADPISKTFKTEIMVANPGQRIKAGIFAEVEITIDKKENVLLLPVSAILQENDGPYVVLYNNGAARYKKIKIGKQNDRDCEILTGLSEGEPVVVEGNYDLKEKTPISKRGAVE